MSQVVLILNSLYSFFITRRSLGFSWRTFMLPTNVLRKRPPADGNKSRISLKDDLTSSKTSA